MDSRHRHLKNAENEFWCLLLILQKKKKTSNERLEDLLSKSSQAVSDLATAYKTNKVEEKQESSDPHAVVISQALKSVESENQLSCLIAVLQLIENFKK